jgi:membrane associated rhomboid family serine protease
MFPLTPVVRNLLFINIGLLILKPILGFHAVDFLSFHNFASPQFSPHQIVTYMFMHADWRHLFSNMLALYFFGPTLEYTWGGKKFLQYYIFTGVGACLLYAGVNYYEMSRFADNSDEYFLIANTPMLGASGAVFGLLAAFAILFPNAEMVVFPIPVPIKAKYLVSFYALYEIYAGIYQNQSNIAHFAHVGGLIIGFLLVKYWEGGRR